MCLSCHWRSIDEEHLLISSLESGAPLSEVPTQQLTWQPSFSFLLAGKRGLFCLSFFYALTHLAIKLYNLLTGEQSHLSRGSRPSHSPGKVTFWQVSGAPFPEVLYPVTQLTIKLYWPSDKVVDGSTF